MHRALSSTLDLAGYLFCLSPCCATTILYKMHFCNLSPNVMSRHYQDIWFYLEYYLPLRWISKTPTSRAIVRESLYALTWPAVNALAICVVVGIAVCRLCWKSKRYDLVLLWWKNGECPKKNPLVRRWQSEPLLMSLKLHYSSCLDNNFWFWGALVQGGVLLTCHLVSRLTDCMNWSNLTFNQGNYYFYEILLSLLDLVYYIAYILLWKPTWETPIVTLHS